MPEDLSAHAAGDDLSAHGEHHIIPPAVYYKVFGGLMILLVLTVVAAMVDLGPLNILIAMTIAVAKVVLILLYFMHLRYNTNLVRFFATAAFIWLMILFVLTLSDYVSRGWLEGGTKFDLL